MKTSQMTIFNIYKKLETLNLTSSEIYQILEYVLKEDYDWIVQNINDQILIDQVNIFENIFKGLENHEPVAYITNEMVFNSNTFFVDQRVLIPRIETEKIISLVIEELIFQKDKLLIADLCSGSGCIGLSLAKLNKTNLVQCSDISNDALEVIKMNKEKLKLDNVEIIKSDFISYLNEQKQKPNILIANPPYIDIDDQFVQDSVRKFEPSIALFAKNNGLSFYETLFDNLDSVVDTKQDFLIVLEFGWQQKDDLLALLKSKGIKHKYTFERDNYNNWRFLVIKN